MSRRVLIAAILIAAAFAAGGVVAMTRGSFFADSEPLPIAVPPVPVVAGAVAQHDVPIYLNGVGTVIAYNTVSCAARSRDSSSASTSPKGQTVHTGDLLAQIDPRPLPGAARSVRSPLAIATRPSL